MSAVHIGVYARPRKINSNLRFNRDKRLLNTNERSPESLVLLVISVTPMPARITSKADALFSKSPAKPIKIGLPVLALIAILKLTTTMPNIASLS
jgi:hypothetical protein